ncbi:MAG: PIG-L family deacetylase [Clostridia bacterium]|nr:PIG-L family deacetylase [Clostridia bacterium]
MKCLKYIWIFLAVALLVGGLTVSAGAQGESLSLAASPNLSRLVDRNENTRAVTGEVTVNSATPMEGLYLLFFDTPTDFTLIVDGAECKIRAQFLREYVDLVYLFGEGKGSVTLRFDAQVSILEIYAFAGETPSWVQKWQEPCGKADLCLMTTHADDEQLFFAGVLPYYAGERDLAVQVIYFTDHKNEPMRRHELLRGLWTVGVKNYPVISPFPDLYSESEAAAAGQFASRGFSREAVVSFQVEMLRRFQPLVVVGHDPLGEYGHGQHRLNSATLQEAVNIAGDAASFPESAEIYGVWEVPKTYLHLYPEQPIVLNWDIPLAAFGGKTAFQVTKEGFACHDSQQYTWFRRWLNGNAGEITAASQIKTHSPCQYGLYLSRVGEDVSKNDFFENLKSRKEQAEELARQRFAALEEEKRQKEEAERLAREESERLEKARLAALAEEEARVMRELEAKQRKMMILLSVLVLLTLSIIVSFLLQIRRRRRR